MFYLPSHYRSVFVSSPIGELEVRASADAVVFLGRVTHPVAAAVRVSGVLLDAAEQLRAYFRGDLTRFDLPLDPQGTEFQRSVWCALQEVQFAEIVSYATHARRAGRPRAARAVGAALGRNPIPVIVPCHRVVGANGSLTGFALGIETKRWLLEHEMRVAGRTPTDRAQSEGRVVRTETRKPASES